MSVWIGHLLLVPSLCYQDGTKEEKLVEKQSALNSRGPRNLVGERSLPL